MTMFRLSFPAACWLGRSASGRRNSARIASLLYKFLAPCQTRTAQLRDWHCKARTTLIMLLHNVEYTQWLFTHLSNNKAVLSQVNRAMPHHVYVMVWECIETLSPITSPTIQLASTFTKISLVSSKRCTFAILSAKYTVQGHPRSVISVPIERADATSISQQHFDHFSFLRNTATPLLIRPKCGVFPYFRSQEQRP